MLWYPTLSKSSFRSIITDDDTTSTGKWLAQVQAPDIGLIWEALEDAAVEGRLLAVKKSTRELRRQLGHDLICVYCAASDEETVSETLTTLREIGVDGELCYKSDKATFDGRDEYLWSSEDFEGLALKPV
ncbi:putative phosphothreonine lyase domain-containing protein [Rhizobium sp. 2YAF20]|uniref:putative phosphothreonine lyase domain-containing protein n=1 Tax=Rhizobium sp. 2YAF20 TaxID=3233027 RepID=UPI003F946434